MTFHPTNPAHLAAVRRRLSVERLAPYDALANGDVGRSLRLYEWNTDASAAFFAVIQSVEVVLRNAMHDALVHHFGGQWFDDPHRLLEARSVADIAEARRRIERDGKVETPGRVVAELSFGFWRYLLAARYEQTLWTPALRHAFPYLQPRRRRSIAEPVEQLHHLRNRIAHHEPIHRRSLARDHEAAAAILAAICPHTEAWMRGFSRVPTVLESSGGTHPRRAAGGGAGRQRVGQGVHIGQ